MNRWEWPIADPFGTGAPNENPAGAGAFSYNLRFPGQYYDVETGKHYNYFRDYDPAIGRYLKSDPIGLVAGTQSYGYARGSPSRLADSLGLYVEGFYDLSTGHLFLYDYDSKQTISGDFESGGKPYGDPITPGVYAILQQPNPDFFRLDPIDASPYDDVNSTNNRDFIRLHRPGRTIGCIAAKDWNNWTLVRDLIRGTKVRKFPNGISWTVVPGTSIRLWSKPDQFVEYGRLYVVPK